MNRMDQHLKERLVGAAVLVTLGMLIIPSLLDGPPEEEPVRVGLELPAPDDGRESHVIRLDVPPGRPATPGSGSIARPTPPAPPPDPEPETETSQAQEKPPPEDGDDPRATRPAPSANSAPTPRPRGTWTVQVGSFSNADNARKLSRELSDRGYEVSVSQVETGGKTMHRVRVGPVPDKDAAEALSARLKASGYAGRLVAEEG